MNISVFGLGYVDLSNALLLAQNDSVVGYDVDSKRIHLLQKKQSPIDEPEIQDFLLKDLDMHFTNQFNEAVSHGELLIIAIPTDYDDKTNHFDTSSVERVICRSFILLKMDHLKKTSVRIYSMHGELVFQIKQTIFIRKILANMKPRRSFLMN